MIDDIFMHEKKQILNELYKHNKKLLFPASVISSMKKQKLVIYCYLYFILSS